MYQPNNQFPHFESSQGVESGDGAPLDNVNEIHETNDAQYHQVSANVAGEESTPVDGDHHTVFQTDPESSSRGEESSAAALPIPPEYYHANVHESQGQEDFESKQQSQDLSHHDKDQFVPFPLDPTAMTMPPLSGTEASISQLHAAHGQKIVPSLVDASSLLVLQQQQQRQEYPESDKCLTRKQNARMNGIWQKHLEELKEFKERHGHVSVPRKSGPLGEW
jgi:hypothetical protein